MKRKMYIGKRIGPVPQVWVTEGFGTRKLPAEPSLAIANHSPCGFEWGYAGTGPSQLALGLLLDYYGPEVARESYQLFKSVICLMPDDGWELRGEEIQMWMNGSLANDFSQAMQYFVRKWEGAKERMR